MNNAVEQWLRNKIEEIVVDGDYDYADNYRYAEVSDPEGLKQYEAQAEAGCCGSYDSEVVCQLDEKTYKIGFNYGH